MTNICIRCFPQSATYGISQSICLFSFAVASFNSDCKSKWERIAKKKMFDLENKSKKINTIQLKERSEEKKIRQRMKMFQWMAKFSYEKRLLLLSKSRLQTNKKTNFRYFSGELFSKPFVVSRETDLFSSSNLSNKMNL